MDYSLTPDLLRRGRLVGHLHDTLLVIELPHGLLLMDQHRAHERVIFDSVRRSFSPGRSGAGQALLRPLVLDLAAEQAERLRIRLEALAPIGFAYERFGGRQFLVRSIPSIVDSPGWADSVLDLLTVAADDDEHIWEQELLAGAACAAAVRRGQPLRPDEARSLLE